MVGSPNHISSTFHFKILSPRLVYPLNLSYFSLP
jgi:hypothetical protein